MLEIKLIIFVVTFNTYENVSAMNTNGALSGYKLAFTASELTPSNVFILL